VGFEAASSPYSLSDDYLLNDPCQRNSQTWDFHEPETEPKGKIVARVPCPRPVYSGPFSLPPAPQWFTPETATFYVWAERPVGSCHPHATHEEDEGAILTRPAEPPLCPQERCSPSLTVTLPAIVNVAAPKLVNTHQTSSIV
jgi:hypothetical protein